MEASIDAYVKLKTESGGRSQKVRYAGHGRKRTQKRSTHFALIIQLSYAELCQRKYFLQKAMCMKFAPIVRVFLPTALRTSRNSRHFKNVIASNCLRDILQLSVN